MDLPQEIELWYVIPAIRKALVTELKKKNLKQKDIAELLCITEPAVSQYVRDKRAVCCYDAFQSEPLCSEIKNSSEIIITNKKNNPTVAIREINRLCKIIKERKIICDIHKKQNPNLKSCGICYPE